MSIQHIRRFILAFDFGGTKMALATATEDREILEQTEISTVECGDGPTALKQAILAGRELVRKTKVSVGGELTGVGVATMGITSSAGVAMAPNVPGWSDLRIESAMSEAFPGVPIRIDNDVKAAALAEVRRGALKGADFGIYMNFGTGVAAAFTLGDRVLQGHNGASGEIAYFLRSKDENKGFREGVTPLEDFCGGRAIGLRASEQFGETLTAKDVFDRADTDEQARTFIEQMSQEIAFHLTNVIIAWDPEIVVLGGGIATGNDRLLPYIRQRVEQFVPFPPQLKPAFFNRHAALFGAIELAVESQMQDTR